MNIEVSVVFDSESEPLRANLTGYYVNVTEITNNTIICNLNFVDPIKVSQGYSPD